MIDWRDMIVWCNAFSEMTARAPVYCSDAGFTIPFKDPTGGSCGSIRNTTPGSFDTPYVNWNCSGYRLPTEGEWEYTARYINGSSWTPFNYASGDTAPYNTSTTIGDYCWYLANSGGVTHDVGGKLPNALGIYDMSGNVFEWCWDLYGDYPGTSTNYRGSDNGSDRMARGGGYYVNANWLQVGIRGWGVGPCNEGNGFGFRLARTQ
jgi:formylglycine-generating enzyme required for sulfatase activity